MFTEYLLGVGDNVKCFNGNRGIVRSLYWPHLKIDFYGLIIETHVANICEETHVANICEINGLFVEPMVDKLVFNEI